MHQQAKLLEILTKFSRTPLFWRIGSRTPHPPEMKFFPESKICPYPAHAPTPKKLKTLTFFLDSKSDLTQNTPVKMKFFPESKSVLTQHMPPSPKNWKL